MHYTLLQPNKYKRELRIKKMKERISLFVLLLVVGCLWFEFAMACGLVVLDK